MDKFWNSHIRQKIATKKESMVKIKKKKMLDLIDERLIDMFDGFKT